MMRLHRPASFGPNWPRHCLTSLGGPAVAPPQARIPDGSYVLTADPGRLRREPGQRVQGPAEAHLAGKGMGGEGMARSSFTPGRTGVDDTDSSSSGFAGSDGQRRSGGPGRLSEVVPEGRRLLPIPAGVPPNGARVRAPNSAVRPECWHRRSRSDMGLRCLSHVDLLLRWAGFRSGAPLDGAFLVAIRPPSPLRVAPVEADSPCDRTPVWGTLHR